MRTLKKISPIISYVFTVLYMIVAAMFFSVGNYLYIPFIALALISLYDGILVSSVYERPNELTAKNDKIKYLVYLCVSIVSPISFILNLIVYFKRTDETDEKPAYKSVIAPKLAVKKPFFKQTNFIIVIISLYLILSSGFMGMFFETSGFSVTVTDFTLTKEMTESYHTYDDDVIKNDSLHYGVTMYVPNSVNAENTGSTVIVMPGFTRTKATMAQYAIELSRRGFVVFTLDPNEQGASGYVGFDENGESMSYTTGANGLYYLIDYIYTNTELFDFIDRNNIGLIGHSAGGGNVMDAAQHFNRPIADYSKSWIKAVYCSGYIKTSAANRYSTIYANAAMAYAYYDEGAFRYQDDSTALEVISLRFVNEVSGKNNGLTAYEIDKEYGSMADGTYRVIHREPTNHCFEMYDGLSIANSISFFTSALHMNTSLAPSEQIWFMKEICTLLSLVAGFMLIISLSGLLIANVPFFALAKGKRIINGAYVDEETLSAAVDEPELLPPPRRRTNYTKILFWSTFILTAIIACLDYVPLAYLSIKWLPDAASNKFTTLFPARMVNAILLWATVNGLVGLILFFGTIFIENLVIKLRAKRRGEEVTLDWSKFRPLKTDWKGLGVTFLLAIILFCVFYGMIAFNYALFHQDFRFLLISAAPLSTRFIVTWLEYIPLIFIFYIGNSIRVNCGIGYEGWSETKTTIVSAIGNSVGLVFILIINYYCFFSTGSPFYGYFGNPAEEVWLYINMVFALVPMMFILPIFNRLFYRQTNRVYLGPLVTCMIFVMMTLSASISFMPVA